MFSDRADTTEKRDRKRQAQPGKTRKFLQMIDHKPKSYSQKVTSQVV